MHANYVVLATFFLTRETTFPPPLLGPAEAVLASSFRPLSSRRILDASSCCGDAQRQAAHGLQGGVE